MSYITLLGCIALSDSRRKALVEELAVKKIRARWIHFVALHDGGSTQTNELNVLSHLLAYDEDYSYDDEDEEHTTTWFIQPRRGTISPWSSKATSIAESCGLGRVVKRIERGIIVKFAAQGEFDVAMAKKELHDPMTQELSSSMPDLEIMFGEQYVRLVSFEL